jgi:UDP-glucose 4-epimerase
MSRILITGSAGFIGSWIAEELVKLGHQVAGADSMVGGRNVIAGVPTLIGDLADGHFARHVVDACEPEILVYCAADAHEGASWYRVHSVTRNNLSAYSSTIEACLIPKTLKKIVVFSSMSIYGNQRPPFFESMPPAPVDPYGTNKAAMEAMTKQIAEAHKLQWSVIRPHNVFGPQQYCGDELRNVVGIFMNRALRGEPLLVYGDGQQTRAFSYIEDSLQCYIRAITTSDADGMEVNIGGEIPITILDLVLAIQEEFPGAEIQHVPDRFGEVKHAYSDHRRAKAHLGFNEAIGWREGVHRMAEWAKKTGPWEWDPILVQTPTESTPKHWRSKLWS